MVDRSILRDHDEVDADVVPDRVMVDDAASDRDGRDVDALVRDGDLGDRGGDAWDATSPSPDADTLDTNPDTDEVVPEVGPPPLRALSVGVTGRAGATGKISGTSMPAQVGIDCGSRCDASYTDRTMVDLVATPAPGHFFEAWDGDCVFQGKTCRLSMTENRAARATFTPANTVFWTSKRFTLSQLAAKGSGMDAGALSATAVLAGADAACAEAVAAPGSLVPRGTYVAWMSSNELSARDRLKQARNVDTLRGWIRLDGKPFLDLISNSVLYPSTFNDQNDTFGAVGFTGTTTRGSASSYNCFNWTNDTSSVVGIVGYSFAGAELWTSASAQPCSEAANVFCMQAEYNATIDLPLPTLPGAKTAFLASAYDTSRGVDGADARCRANAVTGRLSGTFRALIAPTGASAASRFHPGGAAPYVRVDGVVIADKDTDLLSDSPSILAPIEVDATGNHQAQDVFTGALNPFAIAGPNCNGWTDAASAASALSGLSALQSLSFFGYPGKTSACTSFGAIYCLQD